MAAPRLRQHSADAAVVPNRLDVEHALLAFEALGETRRESFEATLWRYIAAYFAHIRVEESEILSLAESGLHEHYRVVLDAVFSLSHDPPTGRAPADAYAPLQRRIATAMPGVAP